MSSVSPAETRLTIVQSLCADKTLLQNAEHFQEGKQPLRSCDGKAENETSAGRRDIRENQIRPSGGNNDRGGTAHHGADPVERCGQLCQMRTYQCNRQGLTAALD